MKDADGKPLHKGDWVTVRADQGDWKNWETEDIEGFEVVGYSCENVIIKGLNDPEKTLIIDPYKCLVHKPARYRVPFKEEWGKKYWPENN